MTRKSDPRNIIQPITSRDWFLYYLFNDEELASIRKQWRSEINNIESGEPGQEGLPFREQEEVTQKYVELLRKQFRISKNTAVNALAYTKGNRILNKDRIPTAKIEKDRITISIGPETRLRDIEHLWKIQISSLQQQLPGFKLERAVLSSQPRLAYIIHKNKLKGRKMADIHEDYQKGKLDDAIPAHPLSVIEDFRQYYKDIVQGY